MLKVTFVAFICLFSLQSINVAGFKVKSTGNENIGIFSKYPQPSEGLRQLKIGGHSTPYVYSTFKASAQDASTYCELSGAKLLAIDEMSEHIEITNFIGTEQGECAVKSKVWTSGSDSKEEGKFRWTSTGQRVMFVYWHNYINSVEINCILIDPLYSFKWFVADCEEKHFFICEY